MSNEYKTTFGKHRKVLACSKKKEKVSQSLENKQKKKKPSKNHQESANILKVQNNNSGTNLNDARMAMLVSGYCCNLQ